MNFTYLSDELFEKASVGMILLDQQKNIIRINPASLTIYGYSKEELLNQPISKLNPDLSADIWRMVDEEGVWEGVLHSKDANGHERIERRTIFTNRNEEGDIVKYVMMQKDITAEQEIKRQIETAFYQDSVTGLPTSKFFTSQVLELFNELDKNKSKAALLFLDIDRFRTINESLGYPFGDRLLFSFAERLVEILPNGSIVTRFSGDLFIAAIPYYDSYEKLHAVLETVVSSLRSDSFTVYGRELYVSSSIGVSLYPQDGTDIDTLFRHADQARYEAKRMGRSSTFSFYHEHTYVLPHERISLETELRKAIEKNELTLFYQPQIDIRTGNISSFEALIRWIHPTKGFMSPGDFIPLAEETGLIIPIGNWSILEACLQNKEWQNRGLPPCTVAVNLCAKQFEQGDLVPVVEQALQMSGLEAKYLELEITESMVMQDVEKAIQTLRSLKSLGVKISIDDFGTGYSSLSSLAKFPLDFLKIDRSFITNVHKNTQDRMICSTIIAMAHGLDLGVVAEGVEIEEHLDFLREHHCEKFQGYLFSPAVPADKVDLLLSKKDEHSG